MITTPSADAVSVFDAISSLTKNTNLFEGPVREKSALIPHEAVFVLASGGPASESYADGTSTDRRYSALQVSVRSNPSEFIKGQTLARQVRSALHHANVPGYVDIRAMQSEPIYLGPDESDRHLWSINFEMWSEQ